MKVNKPVVVTKAPPKKPAAPATMEGKMDVKINTIYPVIYNRKLVANGDYYLDHITDGFLNFDSTDAGETTKFQTWYNTNRKPTDLGLLVVDGMYGPLTDAAYKSDTGKTYDAGVGATVTVPVLVPVPKDKAPASPTAPAKPADAKPAEKAGTGMSTTMKIGLGAGVAILLLVVIVLVNKKPTVKS